ncbi:hypothetical protein [Marinobacter sp. C2H3]|uniref:hypothetical protein n=1 Tax=Marinobacter sp. C2H3 TaxID=3119003 RepID=UPI00300EDB27
MREKRAPIFVHSLFRSGSTFLFDRFRQLEYDYWCYQEPLHEIAVVAKDNPEQLFVDMGAEKVELLRHPPLSRPYFEELFKAWPIWKDSISSPIIYDAYFSSSDGEIGVRYWEALSTAAPEEKRPLFQECRTACRIGAIKSQMGGYHIYLWRNPWDQWWSYKADSYFDTVNQIIVNSKDAPESLKGLVSSMNLPRYKGGELFEAFEFYRKRPLTSEQSYLAFYFLWLMAMREGQLYADNVISIDRLSDSKEFKFEVRRRLEEAGLKSPDFSSCHIPQGYYAEKEREWFSNLEAQVHQALLNDRWTSNELQKILTIRHESQPISWAVSVSDRSPADMAEQVSRARTVARGQENLRSHLAAKINDTEERLTSAESRALEAEARLNKADKAITQLMAKAAESEMAIKVIVNSRSWRITAPLRALNRGLSEAKVHAREFNRAPSWAKVPAMPKVRSLLRHVMLYVQRRPRLKRFTLKMINRFPRLKNRLINIGKENSTFKASSYQRVPYELDSLTPRGRHIYQNLVVAISKNRKRD